MSNAFWIQLVGAIVAIACALPGVFLVLRRSAMISDAISHTVLFGIVVGFLVLDVDPTSPILILTAALSGLLTVWLIELLQNTKRLNSDAAIGLVFPILFSIAVILINTQIRNAHVDEDAVLLGHLIFAPVNRLVLLGINLPEGVWVMGGILLINLTFLVLFYKELKITTFDPGLAAALGISPALVHYSLMGMVSVTAVGAFDHVGAILVVALMVAPPATAYLLTNKLERMLVLSALFGAASAVAGYWVSNIFSVNVAGAMASMTGVFFILVLVFAPERGLLAQRLETAERRKRFAVEMLVVHLMAHEGQPDELEESSISHLSEQLRWQPEFAQQVVRRANRGNYINRQNGHLELTDNGRQLAQDAMRR
ncbi:MAG: metal ABC transporter permease [Chloroflexi bacterium]|nr:MAG: metal ABC transporter permease [Chloroflexota bacterium]MBL1194793.1 metal ABC transporter permease [Chloroflexota bacterium]NOH12085.1 metal ABC transporter permease [Chloroflexota bacterium]